MHTIMHILRAEHETHAVVTSREQWATSEDLVWGLLDVQ